MSKLRTILFIVLPAACVFAGTTPARAGVVEPSRWTLASHWGKKVNKTTGGNICRVEPMVECQLGEFGQEAGGFLYPESVAVAPNGNVYVAEGDNRRVQEFTAEGEFVLMFGWDVNKAKVALGAGATQEEKDVCVKAEESECQAGQSGIGLAGQLDEAESIAIDQTSGNLYVMEAGSGKDRIEEFTPTGDFVLAVGKDVNKAKVALGSGTTQEEKNLCKAGEVCEGGTAGTEHDAFEPQQGDGVNLLAVGPTDHLLYVGDHNRVQELEASGKWVREFPTQTPGAWFTAVAVDASSDVFAVEALENVGPGSLTLPGVHEYINGALNESCVIDPESKGIKSEGIDALAIDAYGRLGVLYGHYFSPETPEGAIYKTNGSECGTQLSGSKFGPLEGNETHPSLAFNVSEPSEPMSDRMYIPERGSNLPQEVVEYVPAHFPEAITLPPTGVSATGATLNGEIEPNGLPTIGFFVYGTEKGKLTLRTGNSFEGEQDTFQPVSTNLSGLIPNQLYWYAAMAEAQGSGGREVTPGSKVMFHTSTPAPAILGVPVASFVTGQSVVFTATVNPQHAATRYHFEYGPCEKLEGCPLIQSTPDQESSVAHTIGVVQEARDLKPGDTYSYRLVADNAFEYEAKREGGQTIGQEGALFTTPAIAPHATTGSYGAVSATGAVISGEVNPDGKPASYAFELGVYNPAGTQYGTVQSGPAGEGRSTEGEELQLSGLQPATAYAYRIKVESTYGVSYGEPMIFTTQGLPEALPVPVTLPVLPVPNAKFPKEASVTPRALTRTQKLKAALKVCKRKRNHKQRVGCEREARKRYGPKPKKGSGRKK